MRLWPRRRPPAPAASRANPTQVARMEHDLLGLQPAPGSWAAAALAMRKAGTCFEHQPVDTSHLSDRPGTRGICTGCGNEMRQGTDGQWFVVREPGLVGYWEEGSST